MNKSFTLSVTITAPEYTGANTDFPKSTVAIDMLNQIFQNAAAFHFALVRKMLKDKEKGEVNTEICDTLISRSDAMIDKIHEIEMTIKDITNYEY